MLKLNQEDFATGITTYYEGNPTRHSPQTSPYLSIDLNFPDTPSYQVLALVDTGSPWVVLNTELNDKLGLRVNSSNTRTLSTRVGMMTGSIERHTIKLPAEEGCTLEVDASLFVCNEWTFDNVLGYLGFLQRIRFAFDPNLRKFYFGPC